MWLNRIGKYLIYTGFVLSAAIIAAILVGAAVFRNGIPYADTLVSVYDLGAALAIAGAITYAAGKAIVSGTLFQPETAGFLKIWLAASSASTVLILALSYPVWGFDVFKDTLSILYRTFPGAVFTAYRYVLNKSC